MNNAFSFQTMSSEFNNSLGDVVSGWQYHATQRANRFIAKKQQDVNEAISKLAVGEGEEGRGVEEGLAAGYLKKGVEYAGRYGKKFLQEKVVAPLAEKAKDVVKGMGEKFETEMRHFLRPPEVNPEGNVQLTPGANTGADAGDEAGQYALTQNQAQAEVNARNLARQGEARTGFGDTADARPQTGGGTRPGLNQPDDGADNPLIGGAEDDTRSLVTGVDHYPGSSSPSTVTSTADDAADLATGTSDVATQTAGALEAVADTADVVAASDWWNPVGWGASLIGLGVGIYSAVEGLEDTGAGHAEQARAQTETPPPIAPPDSAGRYIVPVETALSNTQ